MNRGGRHFALAARPVLAPTALLAVALAAGACGFNITSPRERARQEWVDQDYASAAASYEEYLASAPPGPESEEAELLLADIYYHNLKQYDRARDHYVALLEKYPQSEHRYEARQRLAEVYGELKSYPEAIAQYERLLVEHPETEDRRKIRSAVADLYLKKNDLKQAEIEYGRVVEDAPYDELTEQALLRIAGIYHLMRNQDERAVPIYERIATSTSDAVVRRNALYSLSEAYANLFRFDDAIATLRRIDDPAERDYVVRRTSELERQRREHTEAPEVDWSHGKGEGG
jgi:tetratricopeptide (TPR) repeat protein